MRECLEIHRTQRGRQTDTPQIRAFVKGLGPQHLNALGQHDLLKLARLRKAAAAEVGRRGGHSDARQLWIADKGIAADRGYSILYHDIRHNVAIFGKDRRPRIDAVDHGTAAADGQYNALTLTVNAKACSRTAAALTDVFHNKKLPVCFSLISIILHLRRFFKSKCRHQWQFCRIFSISAPPFCLSHCSAHSYSGITRSTSAQNCGE